MRIELHSDLVYGLNRRRRRRAKGAAYVASVNYVLADENFIDGVDKRKKEKRTALFSTPIQQI